MTRFKTIDQGKYWEIHDWERGFCVATAIPDQDMAEAMAGALNKRDRVPFDKNDLREKMDNYKKAERIYTLLNVRGAELGNASILIIKNELDLIDRQCAKNAQQQVQGNALAKMKGEVGE